MSRSYSKVRYADRGRCPFFSNGDRIKERICIQKEMRSAEFGDVIFPSPHFPTKYYRPLYYSRIKEIRSDIFLDIRNILNGYFKVNSRIYARDKSINYEKDYIEAFNRIKGFIPDNGQYAFEWLAGKRIKNFIRNWKGDPFEALRCLNKYRYIEKAIRKELKVVLAK